MKKETLAVGGTATDFSRAEVLKAPLAILSTSKGNPSLADIKVALEAALTRIADTSKPPIQCWIADVKDLGVLDEESSVYINQEVAVRGAQAGIKYLANVVPSDVFGEMAMDEWTEAAAQLGITGKMFDDLDEAIAWVAAQG